MIDSSRNWQKILLYNSCFGVNWLGMRNAASWLFLLNLSEWLYMQVMVYLYFYM